MARSVTGNSRIPTTCASSSSSSLFYLLNCYLYLYVDELRSRALIAHIGLVLVKPVLECVR